MSRNELDAVGWPIFSHPDISEMDEFDVLVEQQDQEMARDGAISPATQAALKRLAEKEGGAA
jgi:hypothetical protein